MNKLAHNLASIGKELYLNGFEKEAKNMLFTSLRIAHMDHPLHGVIEEMGFDKAEDGEPMTRNLEIFIHVHPDGKSEYELVKDKFTCTHRGKIMAMNKGEIDMFFVEGRI